jgi:translation initiation factor 3 subunit C
MSSKFFSKDSDSSESESDEEELYSDEEGEKQAKEGGEDDSEEDSDPDEDDDPGDDSSSYDEGLSGPARFLKAQDGDSSSGEESGEDKVTVIRSAKDKKFEEAEGVVRTIENAVKIDDWVVISSEFDKLGRLMPNLVKTLDGKNPKFYIKVLSDLNTSSNEAYDKQKSTGKKVAADKQRGLNAVRQKVRRMVKEPPYAQDVEKYQADAEAFMQEEEAPEIVASIKTKAKRVPIDEVVAGDDNEGFETVGRDGKVLAFTPESILKSKCLRLTRLV